MDYQDDYRSSSRIDGLLHAMRTHKRFEGSLVPRDEPLDNLDLVFDIRSCGDSEDLIELFQRK